MHTRARWRRCLDRLLQMTSTLKAAEVPEPGHPRKQFTSDSVCLHQVLKWPAGRIAAKAQFTLRN